uniref:Uncharacterized protein n=1 Tax=Arundo donax TaxID=35708 RepID=A0A0A9HID7_ARUDO
MTYIISWIQLAYCDSNLKYCFPQTAIAIFAHLKLQLDVAFICYYLGTNFLYTGVLLTSAVLLMITH